MQETSSEAISAILVRTREQKGLSLEEVADKLNLSPEQIESLESEDLDIDEMNAFERGYLKNYADLLEVDYRQFAELLPQGDAVTSKIHSTSDYNDYSNTLAMVGLSLIKKIFWLALSALVVFGLYKVWPGAGDVSKVAEQAFELPIEVIPESESLPESTPDLKSLPIVPAQDSESE